MAMPALETERLLARAAARRRRCGATMAFQLAVAVAHAAQCGAAAWLIQDQGPGYGPIRWLGACWSWPHVWLLPAFAACSAAAHAWTALVSPPERNVNLWRWCEYAVSSGLCNWVVAAMVGIDEALALVGLTAVNAAMMYTGLRVERAVAHGDDRAAHRWLYAGWAAFVLVWGAIIAMFARAVHLSVRGVPDAVVYGVPIGLVVINALFGVWMVAYVERRGRWLAVADVSERFRRAEIGYSVLSLTAKSYLMWFVLLGAQRPQESVCV